MAACEHCGAGNEPGTRFCRGCGGYLPASEPAPAAPEPRRSGRDDGRTQVVAAAAVRVADSRALAAAQHRDDLVARLDAARERLGRRSMPVAVVGEFKRGKSMLVNALLRRAVCPMDADIVTAVPTLVRWGAEPRVTAWFDPRYEPGRAEPTAPARSVELALADVDAAVSESGRYGGDERPSQVEVRLRHPLLRTGLGLLDTPGVGGLDSAHGVITLSALDGADGALFVTDASQELTAPEVEFLRRVVERSPVAACVVTKTDLHPQWRRIVELDRAHLARAGIDIPVIGVSSFLRLLPDDTPELRVESGFEDLLRFLATDVIGTSGDRAARAAELDVRFVAAELARQVEVERRVVARPAEAGQVVATLAGSEARTARLAAPEANWREQLYDRVQDLAAGVDHELQRRLRQLLREAEDVIDRGDPTDAWPDVEVWLRREAAAAVVEGYDAMARRAQGVAEEVAALFDGEAGHALTFDVGAPHDGLEDIPLDVAAAPTGNRFLSTLLAVRSGSFVPMAMFAAASHLPGGLAALAGVAVLGPIGLALGAAIGGVAIRGERNRQLLHRRQLAKAAARRYLDEVGFRAGHDGRAALRLLQRSLRDEFQARAAAMQRSAQATLAAATAAARLDDGRRADHAAALARRTAALRPLQQAAGRG